MSVLAVQLERPGAGAMAFDREGLAGYAEALARAWDALGIGGGARVAIYDFGSSPAAYLASRAFAPYLDLGAAERTKAVAVCVDGLPDNAKRFAHVLRHFQPQFAFVRAELAGLLAGGPTAVPAGLRTARLVVTSDGDTPAEGERAAWEREWHGGVSLLARCDPVAFVAAECPKCGSLRVPRDLYEVRADPEPELARRNGSGPASLTVRARFAELEAVRTELRASSAGVRAPCTHEGFELA